MALIKIHSSAGKKLPSERDEGIGTVVWAVTLYVVVHQILGSPTHLHLAPSEFLNLSFQLDFLSLHLVSFPQETAERKNKDRHSKKQEKILC